jgi:hypothetical protein
MSYRCEKQVPLSHANRQPHFELADGPYTLAAMPSDDARARSGAAADGGDDGDNHLLFDVIKNTIFVFYQVWCTPNSGRQHICRSKLVMHCGQHEGCLLS